ncbi:3-deoxy-7-phosphoheptulonate synthase [bacterium]|nr:3-deoxy-7-phosphoheptulonate synthase [bacterium]
MSWGRPWATPSGRIRPRYRCWRNRRPSGCQVTYAQPPSFGGAATSPSPKILPVRETPLIRNRGERTVVRVGTAAFGAGFTVIAGPCAIETKAQLLAAARAAAAAGAAMLRAGAFKPRTSPYAFQGLGAEALALLDLAAEETGLPVVSEVLGEADIPLVAAHAQMLQVGSRNMQNFRLLEAVGRQELPVLLKRGHMATVEETLNAAEYIAKEGNCRIVICERGIRAFDPSLRFTLDLAGALLMRERTHLPVIVDPSHATGCARLVPALALAVCLARSRIAEPADRRVDELRVVLTERLVTEVVLLHRPRAVVFDDDVGFFDEREKVLPVFLIAVIQFDTPLAAVDALEVAAVGFLVRIVDERGVRPNQVATGAFYLDDVGSHIGEQHRTVRACEDLREIQHAKI